MWRLSYWYDRYIKNSPFYVIILFLLFLQVIGLNSFASMLFGEPAIKNLHIIAKSFVYIPILAIPNGLLLWTTTKFIATHQSTTISVFRQFLKISLVNEKLKWFYALKYLLAILTGKTELILWVHPEAYMKMHVACALLARQHYYSFFNAPDLLWKTLRDNGGSEYIKEVAKINLSQGKRYVVKVENAIPQAYLEFRNINNLDCYLVEDSRLVLQNVPDFSAFDVGDGFICLKMKEEDSVRVYSELDKLSPISAHRDIALPKLRKVKFRAYIEISHEGLPSWLENNVLPELQGVGFVP